MDFVYLDEILRNFLPIHEVVVHEFSFRLRHKYLSLLFLGRFQLELYSRVLDILLDWVITEILKLQHLVYVIDIEPNVAEESVNFTLRLARLDG